MALRTILLYVFILSFIVSNAQVKWDNVDADYQPLPSSVHVFYTQSSIDTFSFRAFYLIADLKDKSLDFITDTTYRRRLTPAQFYQKDNHPLVIVNGSFFSFETNQNLNVVINKGKLLSYNKETVVGRGKDTFTYRHTFPSAIGISKKGVADVAWLYTDSSLKSAYQLVSPINMPAKDSSPNLDYRSLIKSQTRRRMFTFFWDVVWLPPVFVKWKMRTAIGGGPVLLQKGEIEITNNEELKFAGKAINDKHPRTAMGYTKDNKLIILVIQGRSESGHGASLTQEAQILKDLGCFEALNLDGGGSSCLLVNGKQTIRPSDKEGERAVPAVFIIKARK